MKLHLHQPNIQIGNLSQSFEYIKNLVECPKEGLHIFPELFLGSYSSQDIYLVSTFISDYQEMIKDITKLFEKSKKIPKTAFLVGGLYYKLSGNKLITIENSAYFGILGGKFEVVYSKRLIPSYDIFSEKRYFTPGNKNGVINYNGRNIFLMICEDMWYNEHYSQNDPVCEIEKKIEKGLKIDLAINLSSSPFNLGKRYRRLMRARDVSNRINAPLVYINKLGADDEIIFDGSSFVIDKDIILGSSPYFNSEVLSVNLADSYSKDNQNYPIDCLDNRVINLRLRELSDSICKEVVDAISFGLVEFARKCRFNNFVVALSGGVDSTLVLTLAALALRSTDKLVAIYMEGKYSSNINISLCSKLCKNLGVPLLFSPIKFLHSTTRNLFLESLGELSDIADENMQSRLRSLILCTYSNSHNAMILNTSNKSEIAMGYSTLYGDSVGALSIIGDLYKTEIYSICKYINTIEKNIIPMEIIDRPPSAELYENQKDLDRLPDYNCLDAIIESIMTLNLSSMEIIGMGFKAKDVELVTKLYKSSQFKRRQFCPIIKVKERSFGMGYQMPITSKFKI